VKEGGELREKNTTFLKEDRKLSRNEKGRNRIGVEG